jgi:starch synthase
LEGLMRHLSAFGRLSGILNGIDTEEFNPATDANLPARYSSADLSGKRECKKGLQEELNLPVSTDTPLMGVVSRLSSQKGMDLLVEAVAELIEGGAAIVVQGLGDSALAQQMASLQEAYPESFRFVEKFDAALAQRIYAGCDMFLMPSSFEPCGLGQQIALRYGTIPVVRHTGGLADTVFEGKNGFVFEERTSQAFLAACARALAAYRSATEWQRFVLSALRGDYSWSRSAREYVELYERALADHNGGSNADAG